MCTKPVQNLNKLSGIDLKVIACISMLIDHLAYVCGLTGIPEMIFRNLIGRVAFPVFAFLLVEGFLHTKNLQKYFTGLFLFALLSEVPYDLIFAETRQHLPEFALQNTLFTLSLGLLMLWSIKKAEALLYNRTSALSTIRLTQTGIIVVFALISQLLHLDYGFAGMACIGAMYMFRFNRTEAAFWGCIGLNLYFFSMPGAFLSLLPLSRYSGQRGKDLKGFKYFFYLFYPVHLLLLAAMSRLLRG